MIRFTPDTWVDAVLRPIAMAAPNGHTYVEIMAPDLRFVFALVLAVLLLALRKRIAAAPRGVLILFAFIAVAFVPWLATTGNGRYFIPMLLAAGPLCVGLAWMLPGTRALRAACAVLLVALQGIVVLDVPPWRSWGLTQWVEAPYFDLPLPPEIAARPATFVTLSSISYSLLYPQFHPDSRWMNISSMASDPEHSIETRRARKVLEQSPERYLLVPTVPDYMTKDLQPSPQLQDVMDRELGRQLLALDRAQACRMQQSRSVARMAGSDPDKVQTPRLARLGFWICPLRYPVTPKPDAPQPVENQEVFEKVEQSCPRFFPPGTAATMPLPDGSVRNYAGVDMKLYVMKDGAVYYKYWRALNLEKIGSVAQITAPGFRMDCSNIRGRSGLPWQRDI